MHAALVLMLCSAVVHVGVSQSVIPQTVPPPSEMCGFLDRYSFLETLPNGIQCILSRGAITNPFATPASLAAGLMNYCNDDCGGIFSKYLEFPCNDPVRAELIRLTCTPTNGSATAGNVCYYALPNAFGSPQVLTELSSCDNVTSNSSCNPGCRQTLANLKAEIGCCFQNVYNNTLYDFRQFRDNTQFLNQNQLDSLEKLTNPDSNPWMICDIEPPQMCSSAPLFKVPPSPQCTTDDIINFLPSLPNPAVCGPSIANVLSLSAANDSTELANALDIVCNTDCGEAYSEFLKSTCNDQFQAETLRVWCLRTNGNANAGPYCRFAFEAAFFNELSTCEGSTSSSCSPSCRSALLRFADDIGCCYQDLFNNTFYYQQQVLNEVITTAEFKTFTEINDPLSSPWTVCDVPVPNRCPNIQPPPEDCPSGTYRRNHRCEPCPDNTNITLSGGNTTECPCLEGFFRSNEEGPSESCSAPPSGCRNIQAIHRTATQITLRWKRPINTGRDDFYYEIEYSDGEDTGEHSLESKMEYVQEEITGLKPDTRYEFTIIVNNGVSDQDDRNEDLRSCELTTRTMEGRPSPPREVQGFCSVVVWKMPRSPNGKIIGYDLRIIHEEAVILSESDGPFLVVREVNQLIGALVQVRAKTRAGPGNWSEPVPLGCEEESVITCPPCNCPGTSQPPAGLHFIIGGRVYGNNSVVSLTDVGEGEANALICRTDSINCCGTLPNRFGQFYYPSGVQVPVNNAGQDFYRNRGDQLIRLNRREGATSSTGRYRCEIPDASGEMQNLYITLE